MSILGILFSEEERAMIRKAVMATWEREHPPSPKVHPADKKFPLEDSHWNRGEVGDLRNMIIKGIRESVSRSQNRADVQGKDEGTTLLSSQAKRPNEKIFRIKFR
jgi:hypothetical protein